MPNTVPNMYSNAPWSNKRSVNGAGTLFNRFDQAFAQFLQEQQPSNTPGHLELVQLLSHQFSKGHTCLDLRALSEGDWSTLGTDPSERVWPAKDYTVLASSMPWIQGNMSPLVLSGHLLYLRKNWEAEQRILKALRERLGVKSDLTEETTDQLRADLSPLFATTNGNAQDSDISGPQDPDWQQVACAVAMHSKFTLITGGPGTGKTTTVTKLLALLISHAKRAHPAKQLHIALAAPTGKAAARLGSSIRSASAQLPASLAFDLPLKALTLHKLLYSGYSGEREQARSIAYDVVIIDEASMIDLEMMDKLLCSVPLTCSLIMIGDKDQLASVEAGAVMGQLCAGADKGNYSLLTQARLLRLMRVDLKQWSAQAPIHASQIAQQTVMLRKSYRFAGGGVIGKWARDINAGSLNEIRRLWDALPEWSANEPLRIDRLSVDQFKQSQTKAMVCSGWREYLSLLANTHIHDGMERASQQIAAKSLLDAFGQFQVLCAVREGPWGVRSINKQIAHFLGFKEEGWYPGRPVMVTRNNYHLGLMNGDVGICLLKEGQLRVAFPSDGSSEQDIIRWVLPTRLDSVESVYAMTVHKSQGSEFKHICLVLPDKQSPVLTRELLYTGLTRAREGLTWIVPSEEVLFRAINCKISRSGGLGVIHDF